MSDRNRDNPDAPIADLPEVDSDVRSDIERAVEENLSSDGSNESSPLEPTSAPDGVGGTGGVTKNQDDTAQ